MAGLLDGATGLLIDGRVVLRRHRRRGARQVHAAALSQRSPGRAPSDVGRRRGRRGAAAAASPLPPARRHAHPWRGGRAAGRAPGRDLRALRGRDRLHPGRRGDRDDPRGGHPAAVRRRGHPDRRRGDPGRGDPGQRGAAGVHDPRAGRRGRGDHPVQRPAEHGRRTRSARLSRPATPSCSSPPSRPRCAPSRWRRPCSRRGCHPASCSWCAGRGRPPGPRWWRDPRFRFFTFTGSAAVGLAIKQNSGHRKDAPGTGLQQRLDRGGGRGPRAGRRSRRPGRVPQGRAGVHQRAAR